MKIIENKCKPWFSDVESNATRDDPDINTSWKSKAHAKYGFSCVDVSTTEATIAKVLFFTIMMVVVSPGFPVRVSLGFLGFPWVSRVSWGFRMPPKAFPKPDDCENIGPIFGRLGFPPALQPFFKIKKGRMLMCLGDFGVRQGLGVGLEMATDACSRIL